jgi:hypothetical protein
VSYNLYLRHKKHKDRPNTTLLFQTPTNVTEKAIKSGNPFAVYKDWIKAEGFYSTAGMEMHFAKIQEALDEGWEFGAC